jgi:hypothetical protein
VESPRNVELKEGGSGKDANGDEERATGAVTPRLPGNWGDAPPYCPASATGRLTGRRGVPGAGKSKDEDTPKSRFPSKRELARRDTARIDKQRRDDEAMDAMDAMERQAILLRITGQSLGTMQAGPQEPPGRNG